MPAEDVRRRFLRGVNNFFRLYEPLLDSRMLFDNSMSRPVLIVKRKNGHRGILNKELFETVQRSAR